MDLRAYKCERYIKGWDGCCICVGQRNASIINQLFMMPEPSPQNSESKSFEHSSPFPFPPACLQSYNTSPALKFPLINSYWQA